MDKQALQLPSGFKDYLPEEMIPRQRMFDTLRGVFELFGFVPLETPAIEKEGVLVSGDGVDKKQIYRVGLPNSDRDLALRFDLTVPLARVIALNPNLPKPFKRYQTGPVFRGERPQAGRYRQFFQFDADIVGTKSMMADAEIVALMVTTIKALGIERFMVRINNRKVLNGLADYAGYDSSKSESVLRALDKIDKIGWEGVATELDKEAELETTQIQKLKEFVEIKADNPRDLLGKLRPMFTSSPITIEGIGELEQLLNNLAALQVDSTNWQLDLSIARGLGYYTGTVFETILTDLPGFGSVFSGGRYDDLVERFGGGIVPAVGASVGVDRLFAAMSELKLLTTQPATAKVLTLNFDPKAQETVQTIASTLRLANIPTELYLGADTSLRDQLGYALKREIPLVVMVGENELKSNQITVKNLTSRDQETVDQDKLVDYIKKQLT